MRRGMQRRGACWLLPPLRREKETRNDFVGQEEREGERKRDFFFSSCWRAWSHKTRIMEGVGRKVDTFIGFCPVQVQVDMVACLGWI